jgi:hypothetical protein
MENAPSTILELHLYHRKLAWEGLMQPALPFNPPLSMALAATYIHYATCKGGYGDKMPSQ